MSFSIFHLFSMATLPWATFSRTGVSEGLDLPDLDLHAQFLSAGAYLFAFFRLDRHVQFPHQCATTTLGGPSGFPHYLPRKRAVRKKKYLFPLERWATGLKPSPTRRDNRRALSNPVQAKTRPFALKAGNPICLTFWKSSPLVPGL